MTCRSVRCRAAALLVLLPLLAGCAVAPATGRSFFTGGLTPEREAAVGAEQHEKVVAEFGGVYDDPALARYVSGLGGRLARASELPDLAFTFTVLDSPIVNAFALPGGYVYVTRGLLALADSEAELAGVLAHEIGHVTARHAAERYGQAIAATLAAAGLELVFGGGGGTAAFDGASTLVLRSWSRDQEFEADQLAVRYLSRTGHQPQAMAGFLGRLQAHSRLEAEIRGRPGEADTFSFLQTHPRTDDRVAAAIREAGAKPVARPLVARDLYLRRIDGLRFGGSPKDGFVRGRRFLHPVLGFAFEVPEGFHLTNDHKHVTARGPKGAVVLFDLARKAPQSTVASYLRQVWAKGVALRDVEGIRINGLYAVTGRTRQHGERGAVDIRLVVIEGENDAVYRFLFATPAKLTAALAEGLKHTTYSFRRLNPGEAARLRPQVLQLYRARPGDTAADIAGLMAFESYRLERFLALNGLRADSRIRPGQVYKIVAEE